MEKSAIDLLYLVFLISNQFIIAKEFSGLILLSLSNNKNYRLKKNGVFPL